MSASRHKAWKRKCDVPLHFAGDALALLAYSELKATQLYHNIVQQRTTSWYFFSGRTCFNGTGRKPEHTYRFCVTCDTTVNLHRATTDECGRTPRVLWQICRSFLGGDRRYSASNHYYVRKKEGSVTGQEDLEFSGKKKKIKKNWKHREILEKSQIHSAQLLL